MIDVMEKLKRKKVAFIPKKEMAFATVYFVVCVVCALALFVKFLSIVDAEKIFASANIDYAFLSLTKHPNFDTRTTAIFAVVFFVSSAMIALVFLLSIGFKRASKNSGLLCVKRSKLCLFFVYLVIFSVGYPVAVSMQFQFLNILGVAGKGTLFFVLNIISPLLLVAVLSIDVFAEAKQFFPQNTNLATRQRKSLLYGLIALLAIIAFVCPVYSFTVESGKVFANLAVVLSFFEHNEIASVTNGRTAILTICCVLFAVLLICSDAFYRLAENGSSEKVFELAKKTRLTLGVVFGLIFLFCFPSAICFQVQCNQQIADLGVLSASNVRKGFSFFAMILTPLVMIVVVAIDTINQFVKRDDTILIGANCRKRKVRAKNSFANSVFCASYIFVGLLVLMTVALPFATYFEKSVPSTTFFAFVANFNSTSGLIFGQGLDSSKGVKVYVLLTMIVALASLMLSLTMRRKGHSMSKAVVSTVLSGKVFCAVVFSGVFSVFHGALISFGKDLLVSADSFNIQVTSTPVHSLFAIAVIFLLCVAWLDVLVGVKNATRK